MNNGRVVYNGMEMAAEWPARIQAAQEIDRYLIGGSEYPRVRYGQEDDSPLTEPCHDCGVLLGQYHVEFVCDTEQCPRCSGQVIGCDCPYDGDEDETADLSESRPPGQERRLTVPDLRRLLDAVRSEIAGCALFVETAGGRFVAVDDELSGAPADGATALVVTWVEKDVAAWQTEGLAKQLAKRLRERCGLEAPVLLHRDPDSFVGYFVRLSG